MKRKSIVITGCSGFIGSQVTLDFLRDGWRVLGIDKETYVSNDIFELIEDCERERFEVGDFPWCLSQNFTYWKKDICDLDRLPDCDVVLNIAAESHVGNSIHSDEQFLKSNIQGVSQLLNLIKNKPDNIRDKPFFFHVSTDEVLGDVEEGSLSEDAMLNPSNPYAASKASAELLIKSYHRTYGLDYLILRPTNNYGENQYPEKFIPLVIKLLQEEKKIRLHDMGEPVRNWLHAKDTSRAIKFLLEKGEKCGIVHLSGASEHKNVDVAKAIILMLNDIECKTWDDVDKIWKEKEYDKKEYFDFSYVRPGQDVRYSLDDSKLKNMGFELKHVDFLEELKEVVEHYKEQFRW